MNSNRFLPIGALVLVLIFGGAPLVSCGSSESEVIDLLEEGSQAEADTLYGTKDNPPKKGTSDSNNNDDSQGPSMIYVHLCGAVQNPGVYELPEGTRLFQLIERAGGFGDGAAIEELNQADVLTDGMQIRVPTKEELSESIGQGAAMKGASDTQRGTKDTRININTATAEELTSLSGIGESRALAIISYREEHGHFSAIEDIMNVSGIKEGLFSKIKDRIRV